MGVSDTGTPSTAVSPASLASELANPSTYLALASWVPTFWGLFHLPSNQAESVAVAILHIAAVLAGPLATIGYSVAHALKASAHENRLQSVETAVVSAVLSLKAQGLSVTGIETDIANALSGIKGAPASSVPAAPTGTVPYTAPTITPTPDPAVPVPVPGSDPNGTASAG